METPVAGAAGVFCEQGPEVIDLAMDECDITMSSTLFNRHVEAMLKQGLSVKQTTINDFAEPPLAHVKTCLDLQAAYVRSDALRAYRSAEVFS